MEQVGSGKRAALLSSVELTVVLTVRVPAAGAHMPLHVPLLQAWPPVQALVHAPQVEGELKSASQPLPAKPSQSPNPGRHRLPQVEPVQVAMLLGPPPGHALEQLPQVAAELRLASQPVPRNMSQSAKPGRH